MSVEYLMNNENVKIDTSKAVIQKVTYPIRAISSISVVENKWSPEKTIGAVFLTLGVFIIFAGQVSTTLISLFLVVLGGWMVVKGKSLYYLNIVTNAGERRVLETRNREYVLSIRETLERALVGSH